MKEFLQKLTQKRDLLKIVTQVTQAQRAFILADDTDALLGNIAERQKLIDKLDAIQAELPPKEELRKSPECMALGAEVNALLKEIADCDTENERLAQERMNDLREQLKRAGDGKKSFSAYEAQGASRVGGIFINQKK